MRMRLAIGERFDFLKGARIIYGDLFGYAFEATSPDPLSPTGVLVFFPDITVENLCN